MKTVGKNFTNLKWRNLLFLNALVFLIISCEKESTEGIEEAGLNAKAEVMAGPFEFSAPVYDIATTPDGAVLVGLNSGDMKEIQIIRNGKISTMSKFEADNNIQGIATIGAGNAFVTTAGSDLAQTGALYRVSQGNARMVADLGAFERENDPDAYEGLMWKNQLCEATDGFSAGPQNNPFKVAALSGNTALVADAAGNTLLSATTTGEVDWKAIFTPPTDDEGNYLVRWFAGDDADIPCYVQPVPTSVAVGPDGYIYVGELTGAVSEEAGLPIGLSRVWKIPADATHVVCSEDSGPCEVIVDGLTSVIDIAIGPDGRLYVVEFDEMSWIASFVDGLAAGGTITSYDLDGSNEEVVATGLSFPSAISFDKKGNLWLLENNSIALPGYPPTVRMLEY